MEPSIPKLHPSKPSYDALFGTGAHISPASSSLSHEVTSLFRGVETYPVIFHLS